MMNFPNYIITFLIQIVRTFLDWKCPQQTDLYIFSEQSESEFEFRASICWEMESIYFSNINL
jgi:hypothetical protein